MHETLYSALRATTYEYHILLISTNTLSDLLLATTFYSVLLQHETWYTVATCIDIIAATTSPHCFLPLLATTSLPLPTTLFFSPPSNYLLILPITNDYPLRPTITQYHHYGPLLTVYCLMCFSWCALHMRLVVRWIRSCIAVCAQDTWDVIHSDMPIGMYSALTVAQFVHVIRWNEPWIWVFEDFSKT